MFNDLHLLIDKSIFPSIIKEKQQYLQSAYFLALSDSRTH